MHVFKFEAFKHTLLKLLPELTVYVFLIMYFLRRNQLLLFMFLLLLKYEEIK